MTFFCVVAVVIAKKLQIESNVAVRVPLSPVKVANLSYLVTNVLITSCVCAISSTGTSPMDSCKSVY